jgi:endogenous inhibitor of DNA gyrase (YacG/DUF329 family)
MMTMKQGEKTRRCPICNEVLPARAENAAFPFCSARCQQVDLGRWLGEEYVISESSRFGLLKGRKPDA